MIVPMKKVLLVALREDKDALAQALQQVGEVMPVDAEGSPFAATESQEAARAEQALKVVERCLRSARPWNMRSFPGKTGKRKHS